MLPTEFGEWKCIAYKALTDPDEHVAFVFGDVRGDEPVLVRVHSQCVTGDVFGSQRCDCGEQLRLAQQMITAAGRGVIVYMRQEGRGIGLHNKIKAYNLQDGGMDTVEANEALGFPADRRDYGIGMQILVDLGLKDLRLITNNPEKRAGLEGYGLRMVERVPVIAEPNPHNLRYLETKRTKMGHLIQRVLEGRGRIRRSGGAYRFSGGGSTWTLPRRRSTSRCTMRSSASRPQIDGATNVLRNCSTRMPPQIAASHCTHQPPPVAQSMIARTPTIAT